MSTSMGRFVRQLLAWVCLLMAAQFAHALQMGIGVNPDRVRPGEGLTVAIVLTNDSAALASGLSVQLQLPSAGINVTFPSLLSAGASCSGNCDPGEIVVWTLPAIPPGQAARMTLVASVADAAAAGSTIAFSARVLQNNVPFPNAVPVGQSVTVDPNNALSLAVDVDKDGVAAGDTLTYTLTYGNRSGASVSNTALTLPLPAGVTLVSVTGNPSVQGSSVVWTLGTLLSAQSDRQQVVVAVAPGQPSGTLLGINAASIAGTSLFTGATETARTVFFSRVQSNAALGIAIAPSADPVRPGEGVRTAFTVTNRSDAPLSNAVLTARMPTQGFNVTFPSLLSGGAQCSGNCDPYEFVTWPIGPLAPGESVTRLFVTSVSDAFTPGRLIPLDAEVRADGAAPAVGHHTIAVDVDNYLSLSLAADKDAVAPGDLLTYTLSYGNRGPTTVNGAALALPLPSGVSLVSATGNAALQGSAVQWPAVTLLSRQSGSQQVVVRVGTDVLPGTLLPIDAAVLAGSTSLTGAEKARATLTSRVHPSPVLALAIVPSADPVRPGEGVRVAFTVTNRGDAPLFETTLNVRMPTEGLRVTFPSLLNAGGACSGNCDPYEFISWRLGALGPGASVTVFLVTSISSDIQQGRLIGIEAELTADGAPQVIARHDVAVSGANAFSLALHADRDSVQPGESLNYVLDYANRSPSNVSDATLTFPLPEGAALIGYSAGAVVRGRTVVWSLGTVLAGTGGRRTVRLRYPASEPVRGAMHVDAATVSGNTSAFTGAEVARAFAATRVVAVNPLRLVLTGPTPDPVQPNQALTAGLRVTNTGSTPLNGVQLLARVPLEGVVTLFPSALGNGASCSGNCDPSEFITWNLGALAAGASVSITVPMTVQNGFDVGRLILFEALVTDDNGDQALASGTVMVGTQFSAPPTFALFGDFDSNGVVNFQDFGLFKQNFGTANAAYDLNGDGAVNFLDLAIFKSLFGNSLSAVAGSDAAGQAADEARTKR